MIIGCDFHPRYQQMAMLNTETGELVERRLEHENEEARAFYASLPKTARVGMQATGYAQWFEPMRAEQGHELWIGHASEIRAGVVRKQKRDAREAAHLLRLLLEKRFPRIWLPSPAERDTRQVLRHRYKLVCFRVSVKNQLHGLAMSQGICRKKRLFTAPGREELERLSLGPWASRRGQELLGMRDRFNPLIDELDRAVQQPAVNHADAARLFDPELQRRYQRLQFRWGARVAKVAVARKLAVQLYWLLRATASCAQMAPRQSSPRGTLVPPVGPTF